MKINHTKVFDKKVNKLLSEDEYGEFIHALEERPSIGVVIQGGGGIRKARWAAKGRGKSGGVRIIYYWAIAQDEILMLLIYAKNDQEDLTYEQLVRLKNFVEEQYP